jgi:UDP-N-acetylglucosamine 4-epimerase
MKILLTGGAGFIGSHLADALIANPHVVSVVVLDNLATGFRKNIEHLFSNPKFSFIEGTTCSIELCRTAVKGCHAICHQAALGSVPRSIIDPVSSNEANVNGFLNILQAAREEGIKKIVYASSSSVYGDSPDLPKYENKVGTPLSPYAVTKKVNELYAEVFANQFGINIIGFRYFNVFGARQTPEGPYAAVIPLFVKAALSNQSPRINGDGTNSRDFTYIDNVVRINLLALMATYAPDKNKHNVYNVACGKATSLNELWDIIKKLTGASADPVFAPQRQGDIPHSLADISAARQDLGYDNLITIEEGMSKAVNWYRSHFAG